MMLGNKKKIELNNEELRLMRYSAMDYRNALLREGKYADIANNILVKLKNKMKVDKYDLRAMINILNKSREELLARNKETTIVDELLLKLIAVSESMKE